MFADTETWPGVSASGYYSTFTLNPFRYDKTDKQTAFKLDLTGDYTLFDKTHDFYMGYTYNKEDIRSRYIKVWNDVIYWKDSNPGRDWNQTAGKYNPFNLTGDEVPEPNWDLYDDWGDHVDVYPEYDNFEKFRRYNYNTYVNTAKHHGATFSTRLNPTDKLHLLLGVRYNRFNMGSVKWMHVLNGYGEMYRSNIYGDAKQVGEMSGKKWVPFAGINYDLTPDHTAYVSYAEIFKPQEDTDVSYTAMLPPTIGTNYEIGLKGTMRDGRLNYALALFHTEHKNRAITRPDYGRWLTYADPVGKAVSRGVDVELSGDVTDNLRLSANYTYNKSDYKDVNAGVFEHLSRYNFNNHTPKHIFRLHSQYQLPNSKWQIGGGVSAQSETSSLRNIQQGGYALWHANVRYDMSDNASVSLVGNNLTDKVYFENNPNRTRGKNNFYGEPRNFALKVDWKF
nr:TonB-dependent receptor [Moraxella lacunata]